MPKRDDLLTREKERVGQLRTRLAKIDLEHAVVAAQLEEAEVTLVRISRRKMAEGLKLARAATKATRQPLVDVRVGDRMRDNDPRENHLRRTLTIVVVNPYTVRAHDDRDRRLRSRQYNRSRIYPIGTVRRSGFTLLPSGAS
jgi:hypothetical protein